MSNSLSITNSLTCPNCGTHWSHEVWLLVDSRERPDLLRRMLDGTLDHLFCTNCREPALSLFPLLLFRPGSEPTLMLSTYEGKPPDEQERESLGAVIAHLHRELGAQFKPEWLARGLAVIAREVLADFLRTQQPQVPKETDPTVELLMRYLHAKSWDENRELLERHPELLEPRQESTIARLHLDDEPRFDQELYLLRRCRDEGTEAVFEELFGGGVLRKLQEAERLIGSGASAEAFRLLEEASKECEPDQYPRPWAWLHFAMGSCLIAAPLISEPDRWERAIVCLRQALTVYTRDSDPNEWASAYANLALAFEHSRSDNRTSLRDERLRCISHALEVFTPDAHLDKWADLQETYARVLLEPSADDRIESAESAITTLEQIEAVCGPDRVPDRWQRACINLCGLYRERVVGDAADNVERAIHYGELVLRSRLMRTDDLEVGVHTNLGAAYGSRLHADPSENAKKEIEHLTLALKSLDASVDAARWATVRHNLGHAHFRTRDGDRKKSLDLAIEHYHAALSASPKEIRPLDYAHTLSNLATTLIERRGEDRAEEVERALRMYIEVARIYRRGGRLTAVWEAHLNLGVAYRERSLGDRDRNLVRARLHYQRVLDANPNEIPPASVQDALGSLASIAFEQGQWAEVDRFSAEFLSHHESRLRAAYMERSRTDLMASAAPIYSINAYSLLRLGDAESALVRLEEGKTRRMTETLVAEGQWLEMAPEHRSRVGGIWAEVRELEEQLRLPPDVPGRKPDIALAKALKDARARLNSELAAATRMQSEISRAHLNAREIVDLVPSGGAIVSWLITSRGSAAFVLPAGAQTVSDGNVVWLDRFGWKELERLINGDEVSRRGWIPAYAAQAENHAAWAATIIDTGAEIWSHLMAPVVERLGKLGVPEGAPVLMLPSGKTAMLPLHAAWRLVKGEKRYLIDDYTVWFAPSVLAYRSSYRNVAAADAREPSLLAVVDSMLDLDYARIEGQVISEMFAADRCNVLAGDEVRPHSVIQMAAGKTHIHFACHGFYAWGEPLRSGLVMADDRSLALWEVLARMDLRNARLVTLSACETGLTDASHAPQEFIGLPAGFLQAGAPGVIGTFWKVDDLSTMLLMRRFYALHLQSGRAPAVALREAQIWLRNLTEQEAEAELEQLDEQTHSAAQRGGVRPDSNRLPFEHPYHWAGFALHGY